MPSSKEAVREAGGLDAEEEITLGLLNAVHEDRRLTQRSASHRLGIALGLTNAYLKRCVKKGLIKIQQIPPNRYAYYLTPKGFAEKTRLTGEFFSQSFRFFRIARTQYGELLREAERSGWRRLALCGVGELSEVATLCATEAGVDLVGVIDMPQSGRSRHAGLAVLPDLAAAGGIDGVVLTDFQDTQATYDALCRILPPARVLVPAMLAVQERRA
ncbi:MAG: winged helix-turn-helix transcriptional regulator [Acetobacterales bacterium]